jgi:hypothetical protein
MADPIHRNIAIVQIGDLLLGTPIMEGDRFSF